MKKHLTKIDDYYDYDEDDGDKYEMILMKMVMIIANISKIMYEYPTNQPTNLFISTAGLDSCNSMGISTRKLA